MAAGLKAAVAQSVLTMAAPELAQRPPTYIATSIYPFRPNSSPTRSICERRKERECQKERGGEREGERERGREGEREERREACLIPGDDELDPAQCHHLRTAIAVSSRYPSAKFITRPSVSHSCRNSSVTTSGRPQGGRETCPREGGRLPKPCANAHASLSPRVHHGMASSCSPRAVHVLLVS